MKITGYTYQAEEFSPEELVEYMIATGDMSPAARDLEVENALDQCAEANAIDRYDEVSYDSWEFPKVVFG